MKVERLKNLHEHSYYGKYAISPKGENLGFLMAYKQDCPLFAGNDVAVGKNNDHWSKKQSLFGYMKQKFPDSIFIDRIVVSHKSKK